MRGAFPGRLFRCCCPQRSSRKKDAKASFLIALVREPARGKNRSPLHYRLSDDTVGPPKSSLSSGGKGPKVLANTEIARPPVALARSSKLGCVMPFPPLWSIRTMFPYMLASQNNCPHGVGCRKPGNSTEVLSVLLFRILTVVRRQGTRRFRQFGDCLRAFVLGKVQ